MVPIIIPGLKVASLRKLLANRAQQKALEVLQTAAITAQPGTPEINYITISALELMNAMNISGLLQEGQIANSYEAKAYTASLEAAIGTTFEALGTEIGLEAAVAAGGSYTTYRFHVLQLQPKMLTFSTWSPGAGRRDASNTYFIPNTKPTFLGYFMGTQKAINIGVELFAGIDFEPPGAANLLNFADKALDFVKDGMSIADKMSLVFDFSAKAGASYSRTYLCLVDNLPSFYASANDPNLHSELEANIGIGRRNEIIKGITAWVKKTYATNGGTSDPQRKTITDLLPFTAFSQVRNLSANALVKALRKASDFEQAEDTAAQTAGSTYSAANFNTIKHYLFLVGIVLSDQFVSKSKYDISKISRKLKNLGFSEILSTVAPHPGTFLVNYTASPNLITVYCSSLQQRITDGSLMDIYELSFSGKMQVYKRQSATQTTKIDSVRILPDPLFYGKSSEAFSKGSRMAFLTYWGHDPASTAIIKAAVLGKGLSASIAAAAKYAKYRFQTFASNDLNNFFFTQDVQVVYKQIQVTAGIITKSAEKPLYNSICYNAVVCNWHTTDSTNFEQVGYAMQGSGIAFGYSLSKKTLLKWSSIPDTDSFKIAVAKCLYVSVSDLNTFMAQLINKSLKDTAVGITYENVELEADFFIIESSFNANNYLLAFTYITNSDGTGRYQLEPTIRTQWLKEFKQQQSRTVQTGTGLVAATPDPASPHFSKRFLRARARQADSEEASVIKFRLGIPAGAVSLKLELEAVDKVGNEGMTDLFTFDLLHQCEYGQGSSPVYNVYVPATVPEVAPVSLFFQ